MYSKIKQFLDMVPKDLTSANEIYNFARNAYKQIMGVFPDGLDNVFLKRGAAEMQDVRQKVVKFPEGGKDKTSPFKERPGEGEVSVTIEGETKNMTPEGIMEFMMKRGTKGTDITGDTFIGKAPKTKKTKPAVDPELQKSENLKKEFENFSTRNMTGVEAMKEASSVIGRKGRYKNISEDDAKKLLEKLDERIKGDMGPMQSGDDPDLFADGGRIGFGSGSSSPVGVAGNQVEPSQMQGPPVATGIMATPEGMTAEEFARANPTRQQILNPPGPVTQPPVRMQGPQMGGIDFLVPMDVNKKFPTSGGLNELRKFLGFFGAQDMGVGVNIPTSKGMITPAVSPRTGDVQVTARGRFKDGSKPKNPGRRTFIKTMAGLASLPFVGKLFKPAAKVAEAGPAIAEGVKLGFDKFMMLVDKIKRLGRRDDGVTQLEREQGFVYKGKDGNEYELIEDTVTGDVRITKDRPGVAVYNRGGDDVEGVDVIDDRSTFVLRRNQADETTKGKKPPDEYDEVKEIPDEDGTFTDVDEVDDETVTEILQELGETRTKKASGGLAYMLGE